MSTGMESMVGAVHTIGRRAVSCRGRLSTYYRENPAGGYWDLEGMPGPRARYCLQEFVFLDEVVEEAEDAALFEK
jgi:hypothetical protein